MTRGVPFGTAAAVALALGASCTVQKGGGGVDGGDAVVSVTWSLRSVAGVEQMCPAGTTVAQVIAQPVDPIEFTPEGAPVITLFDCDAKAGTIELIPDTYIISVRLLSTDGSDIYADSLASPVLDLTTIDASQTFDIFTDGGYLSLTWDLTDANGAPQDCESVGVQDIRIVLTSKSGSGSGQTVKTDPMSCPDFMDTSSVVPAGDYSLVVDAEDNGSVVGSFAVADEKVLAPNEIAGLGEITIPIAAGVGPR